MPTQLPFRYVDGIWRYDNWEWRTFIKGKSVSSKGIRSGRSHANTHTHIHVRLYVCTWLKLRQCLCVPG
jgi:hypothetical protein